MKGGRIKSNILVRSLSVFVSYSGVGIAPYTSQCIFIFVGQTRPKASCAPLTALFSA